MWSNQKKTNKCLLSPRQIANKAYTLAIKKLDRDDKRRRPQYTVRERLLLSNTMAKAEDILNKKAQTKSTILLPAKCEEDTLPPVSKQCKSENIAVVQPNHPEQQPQISQDESKLLAVSMVAIAAAVVYSSIQQKDAFIQYNAPPVVIHHTNNTMTTMI